MLRSSLSLEAVPLERVHEEKYGRVLCYPRYDLEELKRRVKELKKLGVQALKFTGEKMTFGVPVLGKGCVGIVVVATIDKRNVALKIRRLDSDRTGMQREAQMLRKANTIDVGPNLINATENFLIMEFVGGTLLPRWVEGLKKKPKSRIRHVLLSVLEQCWRLDAIGLDHGELNRAPKHIIVDANEKPWIVDFETASADRKVSNVTSICQYLFISSQIAKTIQNKIGKIDRTRLIQVLRSYKQKRTRETFEIILKICALQNA